MEGDRDVGRVFLGQVEDGPPANVPCGQVVLAFQAEEFSNNLGEHLVGCTGGVPREGRHLATPGHTWPPDLATRLSYQKEGTHLAGHKGGA